jgi:hypothetical protein
MVDEVTVHVTEHKDYTITIAKNNYGYKYWVKHKHKPNVLFNGSPVVEVGSGDYYDNVDAAVQGAKSAVDSGLIK